MVYNREEAAKRAEASSTNTEGMCQAWTRTMFGAPSVGDVDGDRDADAVDGWRSEPVAARHVGDRTPPRGVPVAWSGGPKGFGHRAVSLGNGMIRSTDADGPGRVATVHLSWVEKNWGLNYLGWTETMSGIMIPLPPKPTPTLVSKFHESAPAYDMALLDAAIRRGRLGTVRRVRNAIDDQINRLPYGKRPSRVRRVIMDYKQQRILRMGMLTAIVLDGRTGIVEDVRNEIRAQIRKLPRY